MALSVTRNGGMLVLAIYLIVVGIVGLVPVPIPLGVTATAGQRLSRVCVVNGRALRPRGSCRRMRRVITVRSRWTASW
jgi:hypothetical protein